jgi:isocitrate dehydrogenase kinase/phosphatase
LYSSQSIRSQVDTSAPIVTGPVDIAAEAWFNVGPDDVFPEEFRVTMGVSDELMAAFESLHGDLFTASFWNDVKERIENGTLIPILPYPPRERLPHGGTWFQGGKRPI